MAIVDGKRVPGITFHKERGKREWIAYDWNTQCIFGLVVAHDGDDPIEQKFRWCSGTPQPAFITPTYGARICRERWVDSSWKKMPEGWRAIFRRDVFGG